MIQQGLCTSFKVELMQAVHNFSVGGDVFRIALYYSTASIGPSTTVYTPTDEITGTGYTAGGATLTNVTPTSSNTVAYTTFANPSWSGATFTARGALIYNTSKGNKAVAVLDFGSDKTVANNTFTVQMPTATSSSAIIRIGG